VARKTYSPSRRAFIAGTVGLGVTGLGIEPVAGRTQVGDSGTAGIAGTFETVVRFEPASEAGMASLKSHARTTQRPFERFVAGQSGISIERQFWAANAALVSVTLERVNRGTILDVDNVTTVHPYYAGEGQGVADETDESLTEASRSQVDDAGVTYPLAEMDVPQAWELYDTRGEGVDVAVVDTGIDPSDHDELAASLERGGWAEFDARGNRVDSEPNAQTAFPSAGHGTSTSGSSRAAPPTTEPDTVSHPK